MPAGWCSEAATRSCFALVGSIGDSTTCSSGERRPRRSGCNCDGGWVSVRPAADSMIRLSVVVTTYNNPRGLELVFAGLQRQSRQDFELLIADDGSGPETATLISKFAR